MGIRETTERFKGVTALIALLAIVGGVFLIIRNGQSNSQIQKMRTFYTIDDGKTWFPDDPEKSFPFDHDGKQAYRVRVFSCDGGKTAFAGYIERYTPDAKKRIEAYQRGDLVGAQMPAGRSFLSLLDELVTGGTEIKRPGADNPWVKRSDMQKAPAILDVKGPDGRPAEPVMP